MLNCSHRAYWKPPDEISIKLTSQQKILQICDFKENPLRNWQVPLLQVSCEEHHSAIPEEALIAYQACLKSTAKHIGPHP